MQARQLPLQGVQPQRWVMRICLKQLERLGILTTCIGMESQKACGAPIVLLSKNKLPRHLYGQFGEAPHVLFDRFLDEATCV